MLIFFFFFRGVWSARDFLFAKTTAGKRYNIPIGKAPPKVGGFQGKEPGGGGIFRRRCRFGPFANRNAVRFFSFSEISEFSEFVRPDVFFFFVLKKFPPRCFCFCLLVGYSLQALPVDVVRDHFSLGSWCWGRKEVVGPKFVCCFKINILDVMVDVIFLLGIAGSYINAARWK